MVARNILDKISEECQNNWIKVIKWWIQSIMYVLKYEKIEKERGKRYEKEKFTGIT